MVEILKDEPWLIVVVLGMMIPIISVVMGTVTGYLGRVRQAELEASLKAEMLARGMSADEIRTVIEASSARKKDKAKSSCT